MEIKFTVDAEQLNKALKMSSIISPQMTAEQERGFLFVVSGDVCKIYSKNGGHEVRTSFPVTDVEGEGSFMYPADYIGEFAFVSEPITFTATSEGETFKVKYTFGSSGETVRASFDPRSMNLFEKDIQNAMSDEPKVYNIKTLQMAIGMAKNFAAKPNEAVSNEFYKTIQIFGDDGEPELAKKANGFLFSSNGTEAFYFYSEAFLGKGLVAPGQHLPLLESFMGQSSGSIKAYKTAKCTYAVNEKEDVIGWPHHEDTWKKFGYYSKTDQVVVKVNCKRMHYQLQFMRAGLHKEKKKIRLHFDPSSEKFWFSSVDEGNTIKSLPVNIDQVIESQVKEELAANVNVNHMLHLFENVKGEWVEFRIYILEAGEKRPKDLYMFRTIDEFLLSDDGTIAGGSGAENVAEGVHVCNVTRFTPGID